MIKCHVTLWRHIHCRILSFSISYTLDIMEVCLSIIPSIQSVLYYQVIIIIDADFTPLGPCCFLLYFSLLLTGVAFAVLPFIIDRNIEINGHNFTLPAWNVGSEGDKLFTNALCVIAGIPFLLLFPFWCCSLRLTGARGCNLRPCCRTRNPVDTVNPISIICFFWIVTVLFVSIMFGLTIRISDILMHQMSVPLLPLIFAGIMWFFVFVFVCFNVCAYVCVGNYF